MQENIVILTERVNFYYGNFRALTDINMSFERNKVTALIGPSGCGKSTLLRLLNRMNDLIDGRGSKERSSLKVKNIYDPDVDPVDIRRKIWDGLPETESLFPNPSSTTSSTVRVSAGMNRKQETQSLVETSLRQAVLWDEVKDILNKSAMALSGGQQQRLCIARAWP